MAGSGYWRHRYDFQLPTFTLDAAGQAVATWTTSFSVAGTVTPNQREVIDDLGVTIRTDVVIECAYHPSLNANGRLVDESGQVYNVTGAVDPEGGKCRRLRVNATAMGLPEVIEVAGP